MKVRVHTPLYVRFTLLQEGMTGNYVYKHTELKHIDLIFHHSWKAKVQYIHL